MDLHDHLTDTLDRVDPAGPDLTALTASARARGARLRRRRRAGSGLVAAVTVLGLAGGAVALAPGGGSSLPVTAVDRPSATAGGPDVQPDLDGPRAAVTVPGAIVALHWALAQERDGTAYAFAGQLSSTSGDHHAALRWTDDDGAGDSEVEINVQRGVRRSSCGDDATSCDEVTLPDGSHLLTSEQRFDVPGGTVVHRVADLRRTDGTRVVASSTNGLDKGETWWITRPAPPLTSRELAAIVRQPFWGPRLPVAFVEAGRSLSYADEDASGWD